MSEENNQSASGRIVNSLQGHMQGKTVQINGKKVFYFDEGAGDSILLVHSWPTSSKLYSPIIPILAKKFRVLTPDMPGFGKSEELDGYHNVESLSDFLRDFIKALKIDKVSMVGVSFGGDVVLDFAHKYPESTSKVIIQSPPLYLERGLTGLEKFGLKFCDITPLFKHIAFVFMKSPIYLSLNKRWASKSPYDCNAYIDEIFEHSSHASIRVLDEAIHDIAKKNLEPLTFDLKMPVYIVVGDHDDERFLHDGAVLNKRIKDAKLIKIPNADHNLSLYNYKDFAEVVSKCLVS